MSTPQALSAYLRAIMHLQDEPTLQSQQRSEHTQHEDGYTIQTSTIHYYFTNGVHLVAKIEQEWDEQQAYDASVCPPCDLSYRVIDAAGIDIQPVYKHFKNNCQLHFWMQAHHLHG